MKARWSALRFVSRYKREAGPGITIVAPAASLLLLVGATVLFRPVLAQEIGDVLVVSSDCEAQWSFASGGLGVGIRSLG